MAPAPIARTSEVFDAPIQRSAVASASENHSVNELWMSGPISPALITDQPTYRVEICGRFKVGEARLYWD